jgi:hypothetical protein
MARLNHAFGGLFQRMTRSDDPSEQFRKEAQLPERRRWIVMKCPFGQRAEPGKALVIECQKGKVRRRLLHGRCRETASEPRSYWPALAIAAQLKATTTEGAS